MIMNKLKNFFKRDKNLNINLMSNLKFGFFKRNNQSFYYKLLISKKKITNVIFPNKLEENLKSNETKFIKCTFVDKSLEKKTLKTSLIRGLDIGKNYFSLINPRRKKILTTLLNSYIKCLKTSEEINDFVNALDLYYKNSCNGRNFSDLEDKQLDFSIGTLWHLNSLFCLDRFATSYCRFEYMDYPSIIERFNSIPKDQSNKIKLIFTLHPNNPNSSAQIEVFNKINKAIEENDLDYLDNVMESYWKVSKNRVFEKPNIFEEYYANFNNCLPNMLLGIGMAYESGLKNMSNFYEIPGVYIEYCLSNNNPSEKNKSPYDFNLGYLSYAHVTNMRITLNNYLEIIQETKIINNDIEKILQKISLLEDYCENLKNLILELITKKINDEKFIANYPKINLEEIEQQLTELFKELSSHEDLKISATGKKLFEIFNIFKAKGTTFQIVLPSNHFHDLQILGQSYKNIFREMSKLNSNGNLIDMIVLSGYSSYIQYENIKNLLNDYNIINVHEIIPRIDNFSSTNDTDSNITFIASSDTRKNDGLLLTELRVLRENKNNPGKYIFLGQGTTSERGGGPYKLIHMKYKSLTKSLRERHIRTVQGFYFNTEFLSKDLAFTFLLNGTLRLNQGEHFNPSPDYMDFLFELDSVVGVPQREMQKTEEWNDLYVKNPLIKTLVDLYDYSGSKDHKNPIVNVKAEKAIVQAYINSDRCSFMHPELAYWDRVTDDLKKKIIKYYYDNNRHFKYVLYVYAFMIKRFDLEFAIQEVGVDANNKYFQDIMKGKNTLEEILMQLGLGPNSSPVNMMYSQHLGLIEDSKIEEVNQKEKAYKMAFILQNYQVNKCLKEKKIGLDYTEPEYKIRILQSALSNVSQFNGKG